MVRREDNHSAQLKALGAEIAVAEMTDVERIADALTDVQRAYYCPPFDPYMIQAHAAQLPLRRVGISGPRGRVA